MSGQRKDFVGMHMVFDTKLAASTLLQPVQLLAEACLMSV